jgi:hypothetical protein
MTEEIIDTPIDLDEVERQQPTPTILTPIQIEDNNNEDRYAAIRAKCEYRDVFFRYPLDREVDIQKLSAYPNLQTSKNGNRPLSVLFFEDKEIKQQLCKDNSIRARGKNPEAAFAMIELMLPIYEKCYLEPGAVQAPLPQMAKKKRAAPKELKKKSKKSKKEKKKSKK